MYRPHTHYTRVEIQRHFRVLHSKHGLLKGKALCSLVWFTEGRGNVLF